MQILGVKVDNISMGLAREKVREFLRSGGQHKIFTPNPEMLVKARKDLYFKEVLNSGDLNLCDGVGLALACRLKGEAVPRITGADFMLEICAIAEEEGKSVYLLGAGDDDVIKKAVENLQKQFSGLKIIGFDKGPILDENGIASPPWAGRNDINNKMPDILFVAFGMGKQEKWIAENLPQMPNVKIAMGVGGAFDYLSGKVKRAPLLMRKIGLEWLYRIIKQPRRFVRIFNATINFSFLFLRSIWQKQ